MLSLPKLVVRKLDAISREALTISKHLYKTKPSSITETRQLIHKLATSTAPENTLSIAMLQMDKELVHMKYHGLFNYITKKIRSNFLDNHPKDSTLQRSSITKNENEKKKARIAFMITREQKRILSSHLGYSQDVIKSLKPLEALMILEQSIEHDTVDWRSRVKELVEENDRMLEEERHKIQEEMHLQEKQNIIRNTQISELGMGFSEPPTNTPEIEKQSTDGHTDQAKQLLLIPSSSKDEILHDQMLESSTNDSNDQHGWFAVRQHFPNENTPQTIALYKTEKEAQQCIEIKTSLLSRKNSKESYDNDKLYSIKKI